MEVARPVSLWTSITPDQCWQPVSHWFQWDRTRYSHIMCSGMGGCPVWLPGSLVLLGSIISRFVELLQVFNFITPYKHGIVFHYYYYYLSIQYSRPWMFNLIDVHLQLRYLQASPSKPERSSEAVVSLLQRVNFAGNMVCKNAVCFFYFCQAGCFISRLLLFSPIYPPFSFLQPWFIWSWEKRQLGRIWAER